MSAETRKSKKNPVASNGKSKETDVKKMGQVVAAMIPKKGEINHKYYVWKQEMKPAKFHLESLKKGDSTGHREDTDSESEAAIARRRAKQHKGGRKLRIAYRCLQMTVSFLLLGVGCGFLLVTMLGVVGLVSKNSNSTTSTKTFGAFLFPFGIIFLLNGLLGLISACRGVDYISNIYRKHFKKIARMVLLISNGAFAGLGTIMTMVVVGKYSAEAFAKSTTGRLEKEHPHSIVTMLSQVAMIPLCFFGASFAVMGYVGIPAALSLKRPLLRLNIIIAHLVLALELVLLVLILKLTSKAGKEYLTGLVGSYVGDLGYPHGSFQTSKDFSTYILDTIQFVIPCCGSNNPIDYKDASAWNHKVHILTEGGPKIVEMASVPLSCCKLGHVKKRIVFNDAEKCLTEPKKEVAHLEGCYELGKPIFVGLACCLLLLISFQLINLLLICVVQKILSKNKQRKGSEEKVLKKEKEGKKTKQEKKR